MNIVLIGVMGAGKTSVGRLLARQIDYRFVDMDDYIVKKTGQTVEELFAKGEETFRLAETEAAKTLAKLDQLVISTGGGVVLRPENMAALAQNGWLVWIERDVVDILNTAETSTRPLLKNDPQKLFQIHEQRKYLYQTYAQLTIENKGEIGQTVDKLALLTKEKLHENNGD